MKIEHKGPGVGVLDTRYLKLDASNDPVTGNLTVSAGITSEGGANLFNQANAAVDFKVGGNSLDGMIHVRSGFDRVGFGVASVDHPFHVGLESTFDAGVLSPTGIALGGGAGLDTNKILNVDHTVVGTGVDAYGFNSILRSNQPADSGQFYFGGFIQAQVLTGNTKNYTGGFRGANIKFEHNGSGTVSTGYGAEFGVSNTSTGAITTAQGFRVNGPNNSGGGTIPTNYGIKIENQIVGGVAATYALVSDGGKVIFNDFATDSDFVIRGDTDGDLFYLQASTDRIGVGDNSPSYKLDVNGDINSAGVYRTNGTAGANGTFSALTGITVNNGIITVITGT